MSADGLAEDDRRVIGLEKGQKQSSSRHARFFVRKLQTRLLDLVGFQTS